MSKNKKVIFVKCLLVSLVMFIVSIVVSPIIQMLISKRFPDIVFELADLANCFVTAIAALFVIYQLQLDALEEERENDVNEADFIFQYNQAFIQDTRMNAVEHLLELQSSYGCEESIINDENRQDFVNYLVYLEGMAPLILRGVFDLEHIDDLMSYRFFLAVNNKEVQDDQLKAFPNYYRGVFKVYKKWVDYRKDNNPNDTLFFDTMKKGWKPLDEWERYEEFAYDPESEKSRVKRKKTSKDVVKKSVRFCQLQNDSYITDKQYKQIAALIYKTDPYIYPAIFGKGDEGLCKAEAILPTLIYSDVDEMFVEKHLYVAFEGMDIVGLILWIDKPLKWDERHLLDIASEKGILLNKHDVSTVSKECFLDSYGDNNEEIIHLVNVCVDDAHRHMGIGKRLLDSFLREHMGVQMALHVLSNNTAAINLYESKGFIVTDKIEGFSLYDEKPGCYIMKKKDMDESVQG